MPSLSTNEQASATSAANSHSARLADEEARLVAALLRDRRNKRIMAVVLGIAGPLCALAVWQLLSVTGAVNRLFIPPPTEVVRQIGVSIANGSLVEQLSENGLASLKRLVPGYVLGIVSGVIIGLLVGTFRPVRQALGPIIFGTLPLPKIAIYPLVIVVFGLGNLSIIVLIVIGTFYVVCVNTASGVTYSNPIYDDVRQAFGIPRLRAYARITLPGAAPSIMAGIRLSMGIALIVLITAEFVASDSGIGYVIWNSWQVLDIKGMFSGLVIVSVFGLLADWGLAKLERKVVPWAAS
jgi:NitT/TauT family transport system permease protein